MVQSRWAGVASVLPASSVAVTAMVWPPNARPSWVVGDVHAVAGAPSRLQTKVAASSAEKSNVADVSVTSPDGPESIVVSGAVVSGGGGGSRVMEASSSWKHGPAGALVEYAS